MTLPLAQAKTGLLALTRREIRNQCRMEFIITGPKGLVTIRAVPSFQRV
jgi:hypothetical protein